MRLRQDPVVLLAGLLVLVDTLIGVIGSDQLPLPLARFLLPAALVASLAFLLWRRDGAEAWLVVLAALAAFTEVNENNLALENAQLFQSFFNNRAWPLPLSPFDVLVAVVAVGSVPRLVAQRDRLLWPLSLLALTFVAWFCLMALRAVAGHHALYETARDLRPPLLIGAFAVLAAPALAGLPARRLGELVVALAGFKALEGIVRTVLWVGVPHSGLHLAFYDINNDLVLIAGATVVILGGAIAGRRLATAFVVLCAIPFLLSVRRGAFVGGAAGAALNLLDAHATAARAALVGVAVVLLGLAAEADNALAPLAQLEAGKPATVTIVSPIATDRPAGQAYEAGDVEASNKFRLLDAKNATLSVLHHPLFGIGLAADYQIYDSGGQPDSPFLTYAARTSHVGYLAIAMKGGLIGLLLFLGILALAAVSAYRAPPPESWILLTLLAVWMVVDLTSPLAESVRGAGLLGLLLARVPRRPLAAYRVRSEAA